MNYIIIFFAILVFAVFTHKDALEWMHKNIKRNKFTLSALLLALVGVWALFKPKGDGQFKKFQL